MREDQKLDQKFSNTNQKCQNVPTMLKWIHQPRRATPPRIKCHSRDGSTTKTKRRKQTDKQQIKDQRLKVKQRN